MANLSRRIRMLGILAGVAVMAISLTAGVAVGKDGSDGKATNITASDGGPIRVKSGVGPGKGKGRGNAKGKAPGAPSTNGASQRSANVSTTSGGGVPLRVKPGVGPGQGTGIDSIGVAPGAPAK